MDDEIGDLASEIWVLSCAGAGDGFGDRIDRIEERLREFMAAYSERRRWFNQEEIEDAWAGASDPNSAEMSIYEFARAIERASLDLGLSQREGDVVATQPEKRRPLTETRLELIFNRARDKCVSSDAIAWYMAREVERAHGIGTEVGR